MKSLTPLILLGLAAFGFFLYVNPHYQKVKELRVEEKQYADALAKTKSAGDRIEELKTIRNTIPEADVQKLEKLLPKSVDNIRLLVDIDTLASNYGTGISNIGIGKSEERKAVQGVAVGRDNTYESVIVTFNVETTYDNFVQFIKDLEQSLRLIDLSGVSFKATDGNLYDYKVSIRTYWLK